MCVDEGLEELLENVLRIVLDMNYDVETIESFVCHT